MLNEVLAPSVSVFLICLVCATAGGTPISTGLLWGLLTGTLCALVPTVAIHIAVHRERLTDRRVTRREQRRGVFLLCASSVLLALTLSAVFDAPPLLLWMLVTMILGLLLAGTITRAGLKVSMRTFCLTILIAPWLLLSGLALLPAVAFARLVLKHHRPLGVLVGTALGGTVALVAFALMPSPA